MLGQNGVLASYREREKKCNTELDLYSESSDEGNSERGQTSQQRTS